MPITSAAVRQLSDLNSQGTVLGINSSDLIGFYGVTPVARNSTTSGAMVTTFGDAIPAQTAVSTTRFMASTAAIMVSTITAVNALMVDMAEFQRLVNNIRTTLVDNGLLDGG